MKVKLRVQFTIDVDTICIENHILAMAEEIESRPDTCNCCADGSVMILEIDGRETHAARAAMADPQDGDR